MSGIKSRIEFEEVIHMNFNQLKSLYKVSEIGIHYKYKTPYNDRIHVESSDIAFKILRFSWDENKIELQEQFKILLMDTRHHCLGIVDISSGNINGCTVDPRLIFSAAIKTKSAGIILAHNHPSGNTKPSENDRILTKKIWEGGKILDIAILDHLIVTSNDYLSFVDKGIMPH